mmetsp:Transcript_9846/g.31604  ORF Transcript_9846/g.31604 Transcript_9846/m.31604 type:complete len:353 (+) Transcript_9846:1654-2712(+)
MKKICSAPSSGALGATFFFTTIVGPSSPSVFGNSSSAAGDVAGASAVPRKAAISAIEGQSVRSVCGISRPRPSNFAWSSATSSTATIESRPESRSDSSSPTSPSRKGAATARTVSRTEDLSSPPPRGGGGGGGAPAGSYGFHGNLSLVLKTGHGLARTAAVSGSRVAARRAWAMVPEAPSEETPARGAASGVDSVAPRLSLAARKASRTAGLTTQRAPFGAAVSARVARRRARRPVAPATASVCPKLDLAPETAKRWGELEGLVAASRARAPTSIGSPSGVAVPWASIAARGSAPWIEARAARSMASWAEPLGAVRLAERPSWRTTTRSTSAAPAARPAASRRTQTQASERR